MLSITLDNYQVEVVGKKNQKSKMLKFYRDNGTIHVYITIYYLYATRSSCCLFEIFSAKKITARILTNIRLPWKRSLIRIPQFNADEFNVDEFAR